MAVSSGPRCGADADPRVLGAGHMLFAVLLLLGTIRAAMAASTSWIPVVAAAVVAFWYSGGALWVPRREVGFGRGWLLGLIVGWLGLVIVSGEFIWLAFLLAMLIWHWFPTVPAVALEAVVTVCAVSGFAWYQGRWVLAGIIGPVIGIVSAVVITEVYQQLQAQSEDRRRLLEELLRTQEALAAREREAGRLAERERLAGDIHDTVGQSLASIILLLRAAIGRWQPDPIGDAPAVGGQTDPQVAQLTTALRTATTALAETRRLVRGLDPGPVSGDGLVAALQDMAEQSSGLGLPTGVEVHGHPVGLPTPVGVALMRAAQEALANVRGHAEAGSATVTLTYLADEVSVDVVDDGRGFDPVHVPVTRADGSGYGLTSMRRRIADCGGELTVEAEPGTGTAVRVRIPLIEEETS